MSIPHPTDESAPEQLVKLHIWDTGGHEKFRSMINLYYREAVGAIICYDLTDERSFESVKFWIGEMQKNTTYDQGGFVMALAGNKCDTPKDQQRVPTAVSKEVAKANRMIWSEVSAKTGEGLSEMFRTVA